MKPTLKVCNAIYIIEESNIARVTIVNILKYVNIVSVSTATSATLTTFF